MHHIMFKILSKETIHIWYSSDEIWPEKQNHENPMKYIHFIHVKFYTCKMHEMCRENAVVPVDL